MWSVTEGRFTWSLKTDSHLNLTLNFRIDGFNYIVTSETMKCFGCGAESHLNCACPKAKRENTFQWESPRLGTSGGGHQCFGLGGTSVAWQCFGLATSSGGHRTLQLKREDVFSEQEVFRSWWLKPGLHWLKMMSNSTRLLHTLILGPLILMVDAQRIKKRFTVTAGMWISVVSKLGTHKKVAYTMFYRCIKTEMRVEMGDASCTNLA